MKKFIVISLFMMICITSLFAQDVLVQYWAGDEFYTFHDFVGPLGAPAVDGWAMEYYVSVDNVIDGLDPVTRLPMGDDLLAVNQEYGYFQDALNGSMFTGAAGQWYASSPVQTSDTVQSPEEPVINLGDYFYIVLYNDADPLVATHYCTSEMVTAPTSGGPYDIGIENWTDDAWVILAQLNAQFSANITTGYVPLVVNFTDESTPADSITSWQWDFDNNGSIDSYDQNPSYAYISEDIYSVKLIVESLTLADTLIKTDYITPQYGPPLNLTANSTLNDIQLTWETTLDPDILIYKIYRDITPNPTTQINSTIHPDTNYVDSSVDMNTTYYYRVTGYTSLGEESDYSNEVSAQLLPQINVNPTSFDLTVNRMSVSTIIDSFEVSNTGNGQLNYSIVGSDTLGNSKSNSILSFNPSLGILDAGSRLIQNIIMDVDVSDLEDGFYTTSADIIHNDPNITNPYIIPITITVAKTPPEKVTGLYSIVTMEEISLFWNPSIATDINKYHVYRSTDPEEKVYLASVNHPDTSYVDNNIPDEQLTYYYWIAAENIYENIGEFSDSISTYLDIPATVHNLDIQIIDNDTVLTWDEVTETVYGNPIQNLTGFIVYYAEHVFESDTLYAYHGFTPTENYTHQYVGIFAERMFYMVTAYTGNLDILRDVITKYPDFKIGELDILIEQEKFNKRKLETNQRGKK